MNEKIKVKIKIHTDCDFLISFSKVINNPHTIKYDGINYKIILILDSENAKYELIEFLKSIVIDSSKEFHKPTFINNVLKYEKDLNKIGLHNSVMDFLNGGNWKFKINLTKITKEYL